jgi:alkanesulfonate monooxygenase SsuD/methylene tetrahydromethanopterin reductase-like flavin-dependent oxidoreductase (luciferase family)
MADATCENPDMSDSSPPGSGQPIIFRVVSGPAGWRIIGADAAPMSTLYLSRNLAAEHAQEIVEVLKGYGQHARVVVEGQCPAD